MMIVIRGTTWNLEKNVRFVVTRRYFYDHELRPGFGKICDNQVHHLRNVIRIQPGEFITLFDGVGLEARATVVEVARNEIEVEIQEPQRISRELIRRIEVATAMPKGERVRVLVEKMVELGVAKLTPVITERSVFVPRAVEESKLHRYVIEASKQCGRNQLMSLAPPVQLAEFLSQPPNDFVRVVADPAGDSWQSGKRPGSGPIQGLIGPEGGLTVREMEAAGIAGFASVNLGPTILRMETAAVAFAVLASQP